MKDKNGKAKSENSSRKEEEIDRKDCPRPISVDGRTKTRYLSPAELPVFGFSYQFLQHHEILQFDQTLGCSTPPWQDICHARHIISKEVHSNETAVQYDHVSDFFLSIKFP